VRVFFALLRPFRFLAKALSAEFTPGQLAGGFALGVCIGLVPKGNLIAIVLMTILGTARVNLAAGALAAFLVSWIAIFVDPLSHRLGSWLLSHESLVPLWTWMYNQPLLPWTRFYNTVVLGSLCIGLVLIVPSYYASRPLFAKYAPPLAERCKKWWLARVLWGTDIGGRLGTA
jgi:uncharacterized protein (TIGR03546 family)